MAFPDWIAGDGDWDVGANWSTGVAPQNGDTVTILLPVTVLFNVHHIIDGVVLAGLAIDNGAHLGFLPNMNTYLRMGNNVSITVGTTAFSRIFMSPSAGFSSKIELNPLANGTAAIILNNGSRLVWTGNEGWGRGGAEWVGRLAADAGPGEIDPKALVLTADSDWGPTLPEGADTFEVLIETTGVWNAFTVDTIAAYNAGTHTITLTNNLVNAHAEEARVFAVNRNAYVFSNTAFGWTLNATNGEVLFHEVYLKKCYRNLLESDGDSFDHCAVRGIGADYIWYNIGSASDRFYWNDTLLFDANGAYYNMDGINVGNELHIQACVYAFRTAILRALVMTGGSINVYYYPLVDYRNPSASLTGTHIRTLNSLGTMIAELFNCVIDVPTQVVESAYGGSFHLHNCLFPDSATLADAYKAYVVSTDHNQVSGAAQMWTQGSLIQKQSVIKRTGDWALEIAPGALINANLPLWIKLCDIICTVGDIISVSAYGYANAAYTGAIDPYLVLDRGNSFGVEDETQFPIAAITTWYQASILNKTIDGGADHTVGDQVAVSLWYRGARQAGAFYIDDVVVAGNSVPDANGLMTSWPYEQMQRGGVGTGRGFSRGMA